MSKTLLDETVREVNIGILDEMVVHPNEEVAMLALKIKHGPNPSASALILALADMLSMPRKVTDPRLTPAEFKAEYRNRGWTGLTLAARWGRTPVWMSRVGKKEDRDAFLDDAVMGLPDLTKQPKDG